MTTGLVTCLAPLGNNKNLFMLTKNSGFLLVCEASAKAKGKGRKKGEGGWGRWRKGALAAKARITPFERLKFGRKMLIGRDSSRVSEVGSGEKKFKMADSSTRDFNSCLESVLSSLKDKGFKFVLKDEQIKALRQLYDGGDLVAVLPTGFGKSLIIQLLVLTKSEMSRVAQERTRRKSCVLVVTALTSIIHDQILEVKSMGMNACSLVDELGDLKDVESGIFDIVFASPEAATDKKFLRMLKRASSPFLSSIVACVIDESHTIETWTGLR